MMKGAAAVCLEEAQLRLRGRFQSKFPVATSTTSTARLFPAQPHGKKQGSPLVNDARGRLHARFAAKFATTTSVEAKSQVEPSLVTVHECQLEVARERLHKRFEMKFKVANFSEQNLPVQQQAEESFQLDAHRFPLDNFPPKPVPTYANGVKPRMWKGQGLTSATATAAAAAAAATALSTQN
eukprot:TRINITY_DN109433_c0_g1_i1.p1 TRINITY_DN109433_c0_g1~~TRINITY_DN109433_c0_g1_i1.p1  ORF type:complete len:182 (+),score=38.90 TRINITY_DN109433_c0_g1_i1:76-621(+)